jgi:Ca2+-binding RTX toxin-like protein
LNLRLNKLGSMPDLNSDNGVLLGQWASLTELLNFVDLTLTGTAPACRGLTPTRLGSPSDETLNGSGGRDVIHGLGGDDIIRGIGGNDESAAVPVPTPSEATVAMMS